LLLLLRGGKPLRISLYRLFCYVGSSDYRFPFRGLLT
jgi:hypothetical protein